MPVASPANFDSCFSALLKKSTVFAYFLRQPLSRSIGIWKLIMAVITFYSMTVNAQILQKSKPVRMLALGDSYTIGESVREEERWPEQLMTALMHKGYTCHRPEIVAMTGWRTDDLKKGLTSRKLSHDYSLVSLLIGVNNQYQGKSIDEYARQFEDLLQLAIEHAGGDKSKVIVLSIPDYGYTPFGKDNQGEISKKIDAFNGVNQAITEKYGLKYINITDISRRGLRSPDLVAEDGLHPSGKMYALWVERILAVVDR